MKKVKDLSPESKREILARLEAGDLTPDQVTETTMVEEDPALTFSSLLEWARAKVKGQEFTLIYTGEANIDLGRMREVFLEQAQGELREEERYFTQEPDTGIWSHRGG